ncbi:OmpP1/FadL family transporter [Tropicimonas sp. IMCC34043]|uniref:OmpP1/FadL family transporter n=1 Tax=Tropicimonas sp. IMCC34043 TaxID=2248760 RepID=UPI000E25EEF5|nr:outer membrane protein transport protein [Tropicimonas sp. IMCC34043]
MKIIIASVSAALVTAGAASAGGLDRTGQPIGVLFEDGGATGGYAEISLSFTNPSVSGTGEGVPATPPFLPGNEAGFDYDDMVNDFYTAGVALKFRFSDAWSGALIFEEPFGTDLLYNGNPATTDLGGTKADAETSTLTALLRYKFSDNWSAYGGVRIQRIKGQISLGGQAYGYVNGYNVDLDGSTAAGYVIGGAYEIPEIALRIALTYNSAITHSMNTTESGPDIPVAIPGYGVVMADLLNGSSVTEVKTPQSINLDFQTGVARDTLLFGSVRWVDWSQFLVDPVLFTSVTGVGLVEIEDTTTYTLGVGRQFTDKLAASVSASYEASADEMISPLQPYTGFFALALGASYDVGDFVISAGVRHAWLGDAKPSTGDPLVARAVFEDNTATSFGFRVGYNF